jgi:hypothetical protein
VLDVEEFSPARDAASRLVPGAIPAQELVFAGRDPCEAGLRQQLLSLHCSPVDAMSFRCHAVVASLCATRVADLRVDASKWLRREQELAQGGGDFVQIFWQLSGRSRIQQRRQAATHEPGEWTVCDAGREYTIEFEHNARCLLMLVPRSQFAGSLAALDRLAAVPLAANGSAQIARSILSALVSTRAALDARSERALHDALIALVVTNSPVRLAALAEWRSTHATDLQEQQP